MNLEQWKIIEGYPNYNISTHGRVKNKRDIILKCINNFEGYHVLSLSKSGKQRQFKVHRLVATHFIDNPKNKPSVDHIDNNRVNKNIIIYVGLQ